MKVLLQRIEHLDGDRWRADLDVDGRAAQIEVEITDDPTYWDSHVADRKLADSEEEWQVVQWLRRARAGERITLPIEIDSSRSA